MGMILPRASTTSHNQLWVLLVALLVYYLFFSEKRIELFSRSGMVVQSRSGMGNVPATPVLPAKPIDPVVTESEMKEYVADILRKNSLWCADGTCQLQNVELPSTAVVKSIRSSVYDDRYNNYMYPVEGTIIFQNIFDAKNKKVIEKIGNPPGYNDTQYVPGKEWNGRPIIHYGHKAVADKNGMLVHPPPGAEVVWVRILNDRWNVIKAQLAKTGESLGRFIGGHRKSANYTPDGTVGNDGFWNVHAWVPIPLPKADVGDLILTSSGPDSDLWVSGIGFSRNPWKHAMNHGLAYHWYVNTPGVPDNAIDNDAGKHGIAWETHDWNNDVLIRVQNNAGKALFYVPVVPSGQDKLVYIVEHNNNWLGTGHVDVKVNDRPIERFRSSYDNPFARNFNGKIYQRYLAARIPAEYIKPGDKFIKLEINMQPTNHNLYLREIGTHDLYPSVE